MPKFPKTHTLGRAQRAIGRFGYSMVLLAVIIVTRTLLQTLHVLTPNAYSAFSIAIIAVGAAATLFLGWAGALIMDTGSGPNGEYSPDNGDYTTGLLGLFDSRRRSSRK